MTSTVSKERFAIPASFAQERLWFLAQMNADDPSYQIAGAVKFKGSLSVAALESSLDQIVQRHESLRTTFRVSDGSLMQVISPDGAIRLEVISCLRAADNHDDAVQIADQLATMARQPFDLENGPLVRFTLFRTAPDCHYLLLVIHHIIADGWSLTILIREVMELYKSAITGSPAQLPPLPIQYADYSHWQRKLLDNGRLDAALEYWKTKLADLEPTFLPADYVRPAMQKHVGASISLALGQSLTRDLVRLAQREQTTLFMVLLAAFKALLHRHTGAAEIVVGVPVAGRKRVELERLIGCFLNTVVLRTRVSHDDSFQQLLKQVREIALEAYSYEDVPFETVLAALRPERSDNTSSLFRVFFNMINLPESLDIELPGLTAELIDLPENNSKFDLTLYVRHKREGMVLDLVYDVELFTRERMREVLSQFQYLLRYVVASPNVAIDSCSLVTPEAMRHLPNVHEPLSSEWPGSVCDLFRSQAERGPNRIAVADPHLIWTYNELEKISSKIANYLLDAGLERQSVVAIYAHRSAPLVASLLGTMRAGFAFLILDPAYPAARLVEHVQLAHARALIHLEAAGPLPAAIEDFFKKTGAPILLLPASAKWKSENPLGQGCQDYPPATVLPDDIAYVAFTSGSTGKPKGVVGGHRSLSHFAPQWIEKFGFTEKDRFSMFSGLSHDPLHRDVFLALMAGATVCIPDDDWKMAGHGRRWLQENRISVMNLTPAIGQVITTGAEGSEKSLERLRYIFFVGDSLTKHEVQEFQKLAPGVTCVNLYGATETQQALACYSIGAGTEQVGVSESGSHMPQREIVPLGRGFKDVQLVLLNQTGQLCGVGELGEIYFRSPHLALGYLDDPELTAERFVSWPTPSDDAAPNNKDSGRLYRTGDLGRYLPGGDVESAGRKDSQVKIRGFRVELAEVEAVLKQHPWVDAAAVVALNKAEDRYLAAYVVLASKEQKWEKELFRFVSDHLPSYMVPVAFVSLDTLPMLPTGKIDRRALPAIESGRSEVELERDAHQEDEEILAGIFAEALKRSHLGVHDNFFEAGGHSLLTIQVLSRVREIFGIELPHVAIFDEPTAAGLARRIRVDRNRGVELPKIKTVSRDSAALPLSFAQQRLWFLQQLQPESTAYNMLFGLRLNGRMDKQALQQSLNAIVKRHEILRTTFRSKDGIPALTVQPKLELKIHEISLDHLSPPDQEQEVQRQRGTESQLAFDLQHGPLLRVKLIRLKDEEHVVLMSMHHIVGDAWSTGVIIQEFSSMYTAYAEGLPAPLPPLPIQYADFAAWQREWLQGDALQKQVSYWRKQLSNVTTLELPLDRPRPALMSQQGAAIQVSLPPELTARLRHLARREGVTLFMAMLTSWQLLLARYSGQEDIAIGAPVAGRTRDELNPLIGFFVNTLVLRAQVRRNLSVRELLQGVRTRCLEAFDYQDVPFEKIVEELQPERDLSRQPFFQVMFGLQTAPQYELELPGLRFTPLPQVQNLIAAKFDLTLLVAESEGRIQGRLEYVPDLFARATVETLIRRWQIVLEQLAGNPELGIARISLMSDAERMELVRTASDPLLNHEPRPNLVSLLSIHAEKSPAAIAVVEEGRQLSYRELNQLANQWAHLLIQLGIRQGDRVIVRLEHVTDVLQVSLGVLKCGAVLVGMDSSEPETRTRAMFELAGARVAITADLIAQSTSGDTKVFVYAELRKNIAPEKDESPQVELYGDSPACILYGPDLQGHLRGVVLCQAALCGLGLNTNARQSEGGDLERIALAFSFAHTTTSLELFRAISRGATVVSLPARRPLPPRKMAALLRDQHVAELHTSISVLERMTREFPAALKAVQRVICEETPAELALRKHGLAPEVMERSFGVLARSEAGGLWLKYATSSITSEGRVSEVELPADTQMYLLDLDQQMELVPDGILGEIYLSGPVLALSYECRPEESAVDFLPDPFIGAPGSRMFRTGEQAWRRSDGSFQFRGRRDGRWAISGMQAATREIENALLLHPDVREAAVVPPGLHSKINSVVAFVAPVAGRQVVAHEFSEFLRLHLPEKMLPEKIIQVDEIPRSGDGQLDYAVLGRLIGMRSGATVQYVAPRNPLEEELASIWARMFVKDRVGIHDNFFQLGGHSLLATQVIAHVNDVLHAELPLRRLFEAPTVAELAQVVEQILASGSNDQTPRISRTSREHPLPLSFAQQRLWFLDQLQPGSAAYNLRVAVRLLGDLNRDALSSSLQQIMGRHESLRTSFRADDGAAVQIIAPDLKLDIEEIDLQSRNREEQELEFNQQIHLEAVTPFDLTCAPLVRVKLLQFAEHEHALLVTMHHIISDAWSLGILVREFGHLYRAYILGETPALPELALQYVDYAVWQREFLQGELLERQVGYWRKQLAAISALNLPTDHLRPDVMSQRGASVWLKINPERTEALRTLSRSRGVTLFMSLLASFQLLLSRYSGQSDIAVGTPIAGRTRTETEGLIGFFINTIVLRATIGEQTNFRQFLEHVRNLTLEAYDHQDVPFEKLVDALQPDRDLSRQPFFQVMFALQDATQDNMDLPGLRLSRIQSHEAQTAKFDLTMLLEENEHGIEGHLEYMPDLFDQVTVESFVERWQLILEQVVKDDGIPLAQISLLRKGEQDLLSGWWGPEETGHLETVGAMIASHSERNSSAIAVVAGGQELSWRELHVRSNQWAHCLRKHGVRAGTRVGVCLPGGVDLAVITMAVLKCGAVVAGLDTDESYSRLQQIVDRSQPEIIITQAQWPKKLEKCGVPFIFVDRMEMEKEIQAENREDVIEEAEAHSPACILYRSSSLGYPVAILVPRHVLLNGKWLRDSGCAEPDRIGLEIGFNCELAALEWIQALVAGICVVDVASRPVLAPRKLASLIREQRISFLWMNAASVEKLGREFPASLKGVKKIFCRENSRRLAWLGKTLRKDLLDRVFAVQGSDEAGGRWQAHSLKAVNGALLAIHEDELRAGTAMYVLDSQLEPTPEGVVGELYIAGRTLADGYYAEPQLTAQTFIPDPFSDVAGSRMYRTGERARRRKDNGVEFCGRRDGRILVDGTRIHAEEVEAIVRQHSAVRDAALVLHEGPDQQAARMVAVVAKLKDELSIDEVTGFVQERFSKVMRPSAIVEIEAIPRNRDGEIDRDVVVEFLRQRDAAMVVREYEAPRNEIERSLCAVWEEVLSVSNVGIHDNFFKLGGDSILSIQVIARARQAGIGLLPRQIFEKQTIAELALVAGRVEETLAEQGTVTGEAPLAPFQREFFDWNLARPDYFNQSVLLGLNPGSDSELVEQAVLALPAQHDLLRTRFEQMGGHWRQTVQATAPDGIYERVDLSSRHDQDAALQQEIARAQESLDLRAGRLMKVIEFDLGAERGKRLLLVIHHLVVDGVSWRILVDDLGRAYEQLRAGQQMDLGLKTTSFKQWTEKLEAYAKEDKLQREAEYWSGLARKKAGRLPLEFEQNRERNLFATQQTVIANLTEEETHALLQDVPGVYNTQINDVLLTALARVLGQWSGSDSVLIDLEGHGREEIFPGIDLSRTVGWFTASYPVALEVERGMAWHPGKVLTRIKEQLRNVLNRGVGYGILRQLSEEQRVKDRLRNVPRAEIIFNYLGQVDQVLRKSELLYPAEENSGVTIAPENQRPYILDVSGVVIRGRLQINWNFSDQLYRRQTIEDTAAHYMETLRELINHCRTEGAGGYTPSDFPVAEMTQQDLTQIASLLGE